MAPKKPPEDEPKSERFNMFISKSEMDAIDEWAWQNRVRSKSEAVRRLVQIGLRTADTLNPLANAVYAASDAAKKLDEDWDALLKQHDGKENVKLYAMELAMAFGDQYPNLLERIFDAHNRMTDVGLEFNAVVEAKSMPDAILAAEKVRKDAEERRERWAQEDALRDQMKTEVKAQEKKDAQK